MAVVDETPIESSVANGVTTVFPHLFTVLDADDLRVIGTLAGVVTEYQNGVDYTVSGVGSASGSVTFGVAPASGTILVRYRDTQLIRETDYQNNGDLLAATLNADLDRVWQALQDIFSGGKSAPTALRVPNGETVDALPIAADRASRVLAFDSNGDPVMIVGVDAGSAAALALDIASTAAVNKGAGQVGYAGSLNYVGQTIGARLNDAGISPRSLGATGDGVADDIAYINACFTYSKTCDLRNRSWRITTPILPPAGGVILADGATITLDNGVAAGISFPGALSGLTVRGGTWSGTADVWLSLASADTTPSVEADYARQIRVDGVHVTSSTIARAIDMTNAVRKVFIDDSVFFTPNGINVSGKCVEVFVDKTIIYSATGAAGTYGVKLRSPAGAYYNEGFHFTDCTIDAFEKSFDVTDIFALTVTGGYHGAASGGYAFDFGQPTSDACRHITLNGFTCAGKIRFAPTSGRLYHAQLSDLTMTGITGVCIQAANNAASIRLSNIKGDTSTNGVLFEGVNNNANIVVDGVDCDSTFIGGVQIKGAAGDDCSVSNVSYDGTGDAVYIERPVLIKSVPVNTANMAGLKRVFNSGNLAGNVTVGNNIASLASQSFAKGETGEIVVELALSGMNAGTQRLDITIPAGMVVPTATGSTMLSIEPGVAAQRLSCRIPYYMTADAAAGTLSIANAAGNTVTVGAHSFFGYVKDH